MFEKTLKPILAAFTVMALLGGFTVPASVLAGVPGSKSPVNLDAQGLALRGYDPVAYFETGKPTHGVATISASFGGARYLFATEAHRRSFLKNPKAYIPEFGGYCVVGAAFGEKVDVDPQTGKVVDGKLYLNNSQRALDIFNKDRSGTISKAQGNWPTIKDKPL